ncbi:MAG TPA: site-2 protease family protein [Isosphaeraceae bacterium]|nr:site-2 protease family protein [Isosphaeraceae bacterium]
MSWKLGRIAGIDLFLHPTFLLTLLPGMTGGLSPLFIVALFGCVVLHELGHALMARRFGIETLDITLYPIGGVARLQRMPRAPGAELLIALAGPAVNFAIVAGLVGLELLGIGGMESDSSLGAFLAGLMLVNLILGLFNLIPAFPMDGGRVLRALLSGWLGRARATSIAATIGRGLALAFGVFSLLNLNLFHVALAAFIYFVAGAEESGVLAEEQKRSCYPPQDQGIWTAPPGYHWVQQGNGVWQLAPVVVTSGGSRRNSSSWAG